MISDKVYPFLGFSCYIIKSATDYQGYSLNLVVYFIFQGHFTYF
jgi:hypothetical protein